MVITHSEAQKALFLLQQYHSQHKPGVITIRQRDLIIKLCQELEVVPPSNLEDLLIDEADAKIKDLLIVKANRS